MKPADLAGRADFRAGRLHVSPGRRRIEGPAGETQVEPLTMQVFLFLLDCAGTVVTREELFQAAWGGAIVGDDSLNRVINRVRRIDADTGPGVFTVETVPRTGYRLTGEFQARFDNPTNLTRVELVPRRTILAGGAAAAAVIAGSGLWLKQSRSESEFNALLARGEEALDYSDPGVDAGKYLKRALALRPENARALGLYAYTQSLRVDGADVKAPGTALQGADRAARNALAIDPSQADARLALVLARRSSLDLPGTEDRLREIMATAPRNINVMRNLWNLLQCVGRSHEALALVDRSLSIVPLAAGSHYPKAQLLWITGQTAEADRVIEKALQYWPSHSIVRFARFIILAFTDRVRAALAMLENPETRPQGFSPDSISLWRTTLLALENGSPALLEAARSANRDQAFADLKLARQAVMSLCALGDVNGAFQIAGALFAVPGEQNRRPSAPVSSVAWRFAPWLFIPATAPMRTDPRFDALCQGIGLTDYWAQRGVGPDFRLESI